MAARTVPTRRHENVCSIRALSCFFMARLTGEIAMLRVRELRVQQPASGDFGRPRSDARSRTLNLVALAALDLDDLLGIEHRTRVRRNRRPRRENAPDLLWALADD